MTGQTRLGPASIPYRGATARIGRAKWGRLRPIGIVALLLLRAAPMEAADALTLHATAGLGSIVKASRTVPVVVDLSSTDAGQVVELTARFGDAQLVRAIDFAEPGTRRLELYLRTSDVAPAVELRARSIRGEATLSVPVRVVSHDETVVICVARTGVATAAGASCSTTVPPAALPRSSRAYDVADEVAILDGAELLSAIQRRAVAQWRAVHGLERAGDLSLTPQVTRPMLRRGMSATTAWLVGGLVAVYGVLLSVAATVLRRRRASLGVMSLATACAVMASSGLALAIGHAGPGTAVRVHHASLLQQIPGSGGSLVTVRGVAEFPAASAFSLSLGLEDASLEPAAATGRGLVQIDARGYPVLEGRFGLSARRAFSAEGVADVELLRMDDDGRTVRVVNQSSTAIERCAFSDGFSRTHVGRLDPGAQVVAERIADEVGPVFTCTLDGSPVPMEAGDRPVALIGTTTVALYRDRAGLQSALHQGPAHRP